LSSGFPPGDERISPWPSTEQPGGAGVEQGPGDFVSHHLCVARWPGALGLQALPAIGRKDHGAQV
jgi:hypothetical protein